MPLRPEDLPYETEALRALVLSLSAENAALKAAIKQINRNWREHPTGCAERGLVEESSAVVGGLCEG